MAWRKGLAAGIVLAAAMDWAGATAADVCTGPHEIMTLKLAEVQQKLAVAARACNDAGRYNRFLFAYGPALQLSDKAMLGVFRAIGGGEAAYNAFKARLVAEASLSSTRDNAAFCAEAKSEFDLAFAGRQAMEDLIASERSYVELPLRDCNAPSLAAAAPSPVAVQPHALQTAAAVPAAPARPSAVPAAPSPAPRAETAQAAEPAIVPPRDVKVRPVVAVARIDASTPALAMRIPAFRTEPARAEAPPPSRPMRVADAQADADRRTAAPQQAPSAATLQDDAARTQSATAPVPHSKTVRRSGAVHERDASRKDHAAAGKKDVREAEADASAAEGRHDRGVTHPAKHRTLARTPMLARVVARIQPILKPAERISNFIARETVAAARHTTSLRRESRAHVAEVRHDPPRHSADRGTVVQRAALARPSEPDRSKMSHATPIGDVVARLADAYEHAPIPQPSSVDTHSFGTARIADVRRTPQPVAPRTAPVAPTAQANDERPQQTANTQSNSARAQANDDRGAYGDNERGTDTTQPSRRDNSEPPAADDGYSDREMAYDDSRSRIAARANRRRFGNPYPSYRRRDEYDPYADEQDDRSSGPPDAPWGDEYGPNGWYGP